MSQQQFLQQQFSLLDCVPTGEFILQRDGTILFWNACLERWTNLSKTQVIGQKIENFFPGFEQFQTLHCIRETFENGTPLTFSSSQPLIIPVTFPPDQTLIQYTTVTPLPTTDGVGYNALLSIQNIICLTNTFHSCQSWKPFQKECKIDKKNLEDRPNGSDCRLDRAVEQIVQRIRWSLNLKEIMQTTVSAIQQLLCADRVLIYRCHSPKNTGRIIAEACQPKVSSILEWSQNSALFEQMQYSELVYRKQVYAVNDTTCSELDSADAQFLQQFSIKATLCVPIFSSELNETYPLDAQLVDPIQPNVWGWLIVHHCQSARQWTNEEINFLKYLEGQLAVAIHQSELHQQMHQLNMNLERQVHARTLELQQALTFEATLKRITDKVRDSLDEQQILQTVVTELTQALEVRHCDTLLHHPSESLPTAITSQTSITQFSEICQQLFQGDWVSFCQLPTTETPSEEMVASSAILACPIIHEQEVLGDLWLFKPMASSFSELEIRLVEQVANQCAIAIRQAQLYKAAQARAEELAHLNRLKDDFLSTISHELRTPIASIQMALQALELLFDRVRDLKQNIANQSEPNHVPEHLINEERCDSQLQRIQNQSVSGIPLNGDTLQENYRQVHKYLHILEKECQREAKLIDDLLDLTRLNAETEPLMTVSIPLQSWIPHLAETFEQQIAEHQQTLRFEFSDDLPVVTTDLNILERIMVELLNNACKYTPLDGWITVSVQLAPTHSADPSFPKKDDSTPRIQICISNTGVEIPAGELPHIFDKFYRIPGNDLWQHGGTGLGLALVKRMSEYLGGSIQVESQNGITRFVLELPIEMGWSKVESIPKLDR